MNIAQKLLGFGNLSSFRSLAASAAVLAAGMLPSVSSAFSEDFINRKDGFHSTFHLEMTHTLALAAGFSVEEANIIGLASSATDAFDRQGTDVSGPGEMKILGTERGGDHPTSAYFHWPRRGVMNVDGSYTHIGGRDECQYFAGTALACGATPEVDQIEAWAVYGQDTLGLATPMVSLDGSAYVPVQAGSLTALGIYLHSLADSYSHETCMEDGVRTHQGHFDQDECSPAYWHWLQEYGPVDQVMGVKRTQEAMQAMWKAMKFYREKNGYDAATRWTDEQFFAFSWRWSTISTPGMRSRLANRAAKKIIEAYQL